MRIPGPLPQTLQFSHSRVEPQNVLFLSQFSLGIMIILWKTLESVVRAQITHMEGLLMHREQAVEKAKKIKRCDVMFSVIHTGSLGWRAVECCYFGGKVRNVPSCKITLSQLTHLPTPPLLAWFTLSYLSNCDLNVTSSEPLPNFLKHLE